jgi:hypothetical protein
LYNCFILRDKYCVRSHSEESLVHGVAIGCICATVECWAGATVAMLLTPKFGKESDLWVRFGKESVWWKEGYFQRFSAKRSAVGYLLRFGKGIVELILRDWTVT